MAEIGPVTDCPVYGSKVGIAAAHSRTKEYAQEMRAMAKSYHFQTRGKRANPIDDFHLLFEAG